MPPKLPGSAPSSSFTPASARHRHAVTSVRKTSRRLADGREIIYYDAVITAERNAVDGRDLPPLIAETELRYDPLLLSWVMYACLLYTSRCV